MVTDEGSLRGFVFYWDLWYSHTLHGLRLSSSWSNNFDHHLLRTSAPLAPPAPRPLPHSPCPGTPAGSCSNIFDHQFMVNPSPRFPCPGTPTGPWSKSSDHHLLYMIFDNHLLYMIFDHHLLYMIFDHHLLYMIFDYHLLSAAPRPPSRSPCPGNLPVHVRIYLTISSWSIHHHALRAQGHLQEFIVKSLRPSLALYNLRPSLALFDL